MMVICLAGVAERFHGFLRSCMLNPHPGVYIAVDLDTGSRDRIWAILERWWDAEPNGSGLLVWRDKTKPMSIDMKSFGAPRRDIVEIEDHYALRRIAHE